MADAPGLALGRYDQTPVCAGVQGERAITWLILGLLAFLAPHTVRRVAPGWREARIADMGRNGWRGVYSLFSIAGFLFLIWGYGQARNEPLVMEWLPPRELAHVTGVLVLAAFILLAGAFVPRNHFKAWIGHPMMLAVALWAFGHLLINGTRHDIVLFGAFLVWSLYLFFSAYRNEPPTRTGATWIGTIISIVVGVAATGLFAYYLHARWIGVPLTF